jgi:hypothetical protein
MRKAALRPIALAAALISIGFAGAHKALALRRPERPVARFFTYSKPAHIRVAYRYTLAFGGFAPGSISTRASGMFQMRRHTYSG